MGRFLVAIGWLLVLAVQVGLWPQLTERFLPAFGLALALAIGLSSGTPAHGPARARTTGAGSLWTGFWLALASGIVLDLYAQHDGGLLALASVLGYAAIWLVVRPPVDDARWGAKLTAALAAGAVYELVVLVGSAIGSDHFPFLASLAGVATLNVAGTVGAFAALAVLVAAVRRRLT